MVANNENAPLLGKYFSISESITDLVANDKINNVILYCNMYEMSKLTERF